MKLVGIDAESNGLYGDIWAIGMVAIEEGRLTKSVGWRTSSPPSDPWVLDNIWPVCEHLPVSSRTVMLDEFWEEWSHMRDRGYLTVADFGTPVEAWLFRRCIADDRERWFRGPYPVHELGTMLLMSGRDPDIAREDLATEVGMTEFIKHNPVHDAEMTARVAYQLITEVATRLMEE